MNTFFKLLLIAMISISSAYALKKDEIKSQMTLKINNVLLILEKKELTTTQKGVEIIKIMDEVFDYDLMARISLGKETWNQLSKEKQKEFTKVFEKKLKNSYIEKLELYNNQKVKVVDLLPYKGSRLQLETHLLSKDEVYVINYNFYSRDKDQWLIYDVDLSGVSIIQTYRQQFSGLLKEKSFDEMIVLLENSNKK